MPLPPDDIRARLAQLRSEFAMRAALQSEYDKEMSGKYIHEMIPFADWLAQRNAPTGKAKGGLAGFLKDSAVKDRVYHGTGADITEFKPSKFGALGPGVYVSKNPREASEYASSGRHKHPNVLPLHIQIKNPFLISHANNSNKELFKHFDPEGKLNDEQVIDLVKKAGYDAIHATESGEINVLDPRKIKSAIGNRGTYDTTKTDITKASGGSVPSLDVMRLAIGGQGPRNWLKGSVEKVIEPLKKYDLPDLFPEFGEPPPNSDANKAVNLWIERNLGNYIRKQLGHQNDPIRKLAEEGVLHTDPTRVEIIGGDNDMGTHANRRREMFGGQKMAKGPLAQAWEDAVDTRFEGYKIKDLQNMPEMHEGQYEPWMDKADPNTLIFEPYAFDELGFDHIVDILKQDLAEGRIRPEQLSKVSIEQAVRRAHQYDQERKKAMAETALKATEGMPVHKDYGDGFKWIELTLPKDLPEGWTAKSLPSGGETYYDPQGVRHVHPNMGKLKDALKYEGDTMGHCVGGYTPDVAAGRSRIFSLRDAKNEPHVTIEVNPQPHPIGTSAKGHGFPDRMSYGEYAEPPVSIPKETEQQIFDLAKQFHQQRGGSDHHKHFQDAADQILGPLPAVIQQIKGKQNAKPKQDYIPYVQDFVKSGNWSDVRDLRNTELKHISKVPERERFEKAGMQLPQYLSDKDHDELINEYNRRTKPSFDQDFFDKAYGKAEGGITHAHHLEIEERKL